MRVVQLVLTFCLATSQIRYPLTQWTEVTNPAMPAAEFALFTAYEAAEDKIWLVGGENQVIWSYNIATNNFSNYGQLSIELKADSQCSVQWNQSIYFVNNGMLREFLFNTAQIGTFNAPLPYSRTSTCVAALYPHYIFVTGGIITSSSDPESSLNEESKYFQIYNYATAQWIVQRGPNMLSGRGYHACVVHNNWLYVFGGLAYSTLLDQWSTRQNSEKIYIGTMNNISAQTWSTINYLSDSNQYYHRAVVHSLYNQIYLIGGNHLTFLGLLEAASAKVQVYDPETDNIEIIQSPQFTISRSSTAAIIQNNILYIFGGSTTSGTSTNSWTYSNLLTLAPTTSPTFSPSKSPTITTTFPTKFPTQSPTKFPTTSPSTSPTSLTNVPTESPTDGTSNPTTQPTLLPSTIPTHSPTKYPTNN
eukprot:354276_1